MTLTLNDQLFEQDLELPNDELDAMGRRLVGFDDRYQRIERDVRLLVDAEGVKVWSKKFYKAEVPLLSSLADRYPLVAFVGDVGTGKTATALALASRLTRELKKEGWLFVLSTRVRGAGKVGEMSDLIAQAFIKVQEQAGKKRMAVLVIDEADSIATYRGRGESHHEDKVAVNTLIQRIDDVRRLSGRVLVILCTNRYSVIDPAIVRRIAWMEEFKRPTDTERRELLSLDLAGMKIDAGTIDKLVDATGPHRGKPGFTYSDIRTRLVPSAVARVFPERALKGDDLLAAASELEPSPTVDEK